MRKVRSLILTGALAVSAVVTSAGPARAEETAANCVAGLAVPRLPGGDRSCAVTWTMGDAWKSKLSASAVQGQNPAAPAGRSQERASAQPYGGNG